MGAAVSATSVAIITIAWLALLPLGALLLLLDGVCALVRGALGASGAVMGDIEDPAVFA